MTKSVATERMTTAVIAIATRTSTRFNPRCLLLIVCASLSSVRCRHREGSDAEELNLILVVGDRLELRLQPQRSGRRRCVGGVERASVDAEDDVGLTVVRSRDGTGGVVFVGDRLSRIVREGDAFIEVSHLRLDRRPAGDGAVRVVLGVPNRVLPR